MRWPPGYDSNDGNSSIFALLLQNFATRLLLPALLFLSTATPDPALAQRNSDDHARCRFAPIASAMYETTFRKDNVEIFSQDGVFLGLVGKISRPTGLAFDSAGNLFVASDDRTGYSIKEVSATDGTITTFTTINLNGPHDIVFDQAGNLYVANNNSSTIISYTPDGVATTFASRTQGLLNPIGLVFNAAGNLLVTNTHGGTNRSGRVIMLSSKGEPTVLVDGGLQVPYGICD